MANRIQLRRDTSASWARVNPVLADGEPGLEIDTNNIKYGDGSNNWNDLPYASGGIYGNTEVLSLLTSFSQGEATYGFSDNGTLTLPNSFRLSSSGGDAVIETVNTLTLGAHNDTKISSLDGDYQWTFDRYGALNLPHGGTIGETTNTVVITPPNAAGGQSLVVRPTNVNPETSHVHLVAGNPETTDIYLGDDDQYIKVEQNHGNVVIGTGFVGVPTSITDWQGGGGWNQGYYSAISTTGGTGSGLTINVAAGGGGYINISAISIANPGSGYTVGDVITINNENNIPGTITIADITNSSNLWTFGTDGNLTLPYNMEFMSSPAMATTGIVFGDGTYQNTAFDGQYLRSQAGRIYTDYDSFAESVAINSDSDGLAIYSLYNQTLSTGFPGTDITLSPANAVVLNAPVKIFGNIDAGSKIISNIAEVNSDAVTTNQLAVNGNIHLAGNVTFTNDTILNVQNNVINLHTALDLSPWVYDDGKDIGIKFHYYDAGDRAGFFGRNNSTGDLEWWSRGTDYGTSYVGADYGTFKTGAVKTTNGVYSDNYFYANGTPFVQTSVTGYATESFVSNAISNLTGMAPATLDTLAEIAANLAQEGSAINGLLTNVNTINANVTAANAAIITANTGMKSYVDSKVSTRVSLTSSTAPTTVLGSTGDLQNELRVDSSYLYVSNGAYGGSNIATPQLTFSGSVSSNFYGALRNRVILSAVPSNYWSDIRTAPTVYWMSANIAFPATYMSDDGAGAFSFDIGARGGYAGSNQYIIYSTGTSIWKTIPLSAFQTPAFGNANVAAYLTANPQGSTYSNANVASYLVASAQTIGNLTVSGTTTFGTAMQIAGSTNTITSTNGSAIQFGQSVNFNSANRIAVNGNILAQSGTASTSTGTGAIQVTGGVGVSGNVFASSVYTNNYYFANGVNILSTVGGSSYGNTQVAAYLPTYAGNIGAANIVTTGATSGNISGANYVSANIFQVSTGIFWANGVAWSSTSGGSSYTNSSVATFLSAFGSNTISTTGNVTAGNIIGNQYGNSIGTTATYTGNVTAGNVVTTGTYTVASIQTTGTYGNITGANVISANSVTVTTFVRTQAVTFANLPTAAAAGTGARAFITDANTFSFASAVTGGGGYYVPVFSNGANWFVG